jgi:uncharacterized membrane protein
VSRGLEVIERAAVSSGLSLATTALGSLALFGAGVRLDVKSWTWMLTGITLAACLLAALRIGGGGQDPLRWRARPARPGTSLWLALTAVLIVVGVLVTLHSVARSEAASHFTELWGLPAGTRGPARIGVFNHEGSTQRYVLRVRQGARLLENINDLTLANGASFAEPVPRHTNRGKLRVSLSHYSTPNLLYRWVSFTP